MPGLDFDRQFEPRQIIDAVAEYYGTSRDHLLGRSRKQPLAHQRQIAMFLCRELTTLSTVAVGVAFGRDHTTVMHAIRKFSLPLRTHRDDEELEQLTAKLKASGPDCDGPVLRHR